jgi:hypothetical protein
LLKLYNRLEIDMKYRTIAILGACIALNSGCMMAARAVAQQRQPDPSRIFDKADTNGDGVITREEFHAARERMFVRLDRNGDGYIDNSSMALRHFLTGLTRITTGSSARRKWPLFEPNRPEAAQPPAGPSEGECIEHGRSERHR